MIELFKDKTNKNKGLWIIRNGLLRTNCVVDGLSEQNLATLYKRIGKLLKIPNKKKDDTNTNISNNALYHN